MDYDKLIERLYQHDKDWGEGRTQDFFRVCLDCKEAALAIETLRADLSRVTAERDAAIKDIWAAKWISCKYGEGCDFISARTGMPDCAGCGDWKWRGIKED